MRTGAPAFGGRSSITKLMVAMALIAAPTAGVSVSAHAAPGVTPSFGVLPVPADPPTNTPHPSPQPSAPPTGGNNGGDYYCGGCDGGAGGGGGGGG